MSDNNLDSNRVRTIPYKIYTVDEAKERRNGQLINVEYLGFSGLLIWSPKYLANHDHIEFFALSDGWYSITGTGYHSYFFAFKNDVTDEDVSEWFYGVCGESFTDVEKQQISLF